MKERFSTICVPAILLTTLGLGLASRFLGFELYPFFSWSMFSVVPNWHTEYRLLIHELDGQTFEPPVPMRSAGRLSRAARSITNVFLFEDFGRAVRRNNIQNIEKYRNMIESNLLRENVTYELVEVSYEPLEMWTDGRSFSRSMGIFDMTTGDRRTAVAERRLGLVLGPELAPVREALADSSIEVGRVDAYSPVAASRLTVVESAAEPGVKGRGDYCVKVVNKDADLSGVAHRTGRLLFEEGASYLVSFKVYSRGKGRRFRVLLTNGETRVGARVPSTSAEDLYSEPDRWSELTSVVDVPRHGEPSSLVQILHWDREPSEWYLDDVSIREILGGGSP